MADPALWNKRRSSSREPRERHFRSKMMFSLDTISRISRLSPNPRKLKPPHDSARAPSARRAVRRSMKMRLLKSIRGSRRRLALSALKRLASVNSRCCRRRSIISINIWRIAHSLKDHGTRRSLRGPIRARLIVARPRSAFFRRVVTNRPDRRI